MTIARLIPRRRFFQGFAWAWGAATLLSSRWMPAASVPSAGSDSPPDLMQALDRVSSGTFAPFVGDTFLLHPPEGPAQALTLTEARDCTAYKGSKPIPEGLRRPFALQFRAPQGAPFTQGTYAIQHRRLGAFDLFLVPIGPPCAQPLYEAVFG